MNKNEEIIKGITDRLENIEKHLDIVQAELSKLNPENDQELEICECYAQYKDINPGRCIVCGKFIDK